MRILTKQVPDFEKYYEYKTYTNDNGLTSLTHKRLNTRRLIKEELALDLGAKAYIVSPGDGLCFQNAML